MNNTSDIEKHLEDDDIPDFKGVSLQISPDISNPISEEESDTESVTAKKTEDNSKNFNENTASSSLWNGAGLISPLSTISKKTTNILWKFNITTANDDRIENDNKNIPQNPRTELILKPFEKENPLEFFSFRDGLVENAIKECEKNLIENTDEFLIGSWLLTEISLWDNEKERLLLLSQRHLFIVKYDFIALKQLDCKKVPLVNIDTIMNGELIYPSGSLVPRLNGLANGVSSVVRNCILDRLYQKNTQADSNSNSLIDFSYFEPKDREMQGVRIMWNDGKPIPFTQKWNPFSEDIPFNTFASHPLFWHKDFDDPSRLTYDVEDFAKKVADAVNFSQSNATQNSLKMNCKVQLKPIILQNYVGLGSIIHNKNGLGFFKVRGKFSF